MNDNVFDITYREWYLAEIDNAVEMMEI